MKLDTIGRNIRKFRLAKKLRQEDLAEKRKENAMREIALVAVGVIAGGFIGVTFMCLFQINKDRHYICIIGI